MSSSDASALVDSSDDNEKQLPVNGHKTPRKKQAVLTKRGRATRTATSWPLAQAGISPTAPAAAAAASDDSCGARKKSRLEHGE